MPTGYTAAIEEEGDTDAKAFVKRCAHAFDVFGHLRDSSMNTELTLPSGEPISFYPEALLKAKSELTRLSTLTNDQIREEHENEVEEVRARNVRRLEQDRAIKDQYDAVLIQLMNWNPSGEHIENLKKFCIDQIEISLPGKPWVVEVEPDYDKWYIEQVNRCISDISRYSERIKEEQDHAEQRLRMAKHWLAEIEKI